jgi:hypothetical protein
MKSQQRVGLYAYLFPNYNQGRKVIWEGMDRDGFKFLDHFPEELREKTNNTTMSITFKNGSKFQIFGTDDIDTFRGTNPVGCVFSEYSYQAEGAFAAIRPILRENKGWAIFNWTPHGRNHAYRLEVMARQSKKWFFQSLTVNDTKKPDGSPVVTEAEIQEERDEGMTESFLQQEYYNSYDAQLETCFFGNTLNRQEFAEPGTKGDLNTFKEEWDIEKRFSETVIFEPSEDRKGILEIWDIPYNLEPGWDKLKWEKRYSVGSDIGEGLGQDYSVAYVYDRVTEKFVARMRTNKVDAHLWADYLDQLSLFYGGAIIVPERTGAGITTCKRLWDLKSNVYYNMIAAKGGKAQSRVVGWVETKSAKWDMCGDLREHLKSSNMLVQDSILVQECSVFVIKENKKIEAEDGFHDDCVIAAALAIQGSYTTFKDPKQTGRQALKEKAIEDQKKRLDTASFAATKEYEDICNAIAESQENMNDIFM